MVQTGGKKLPDWADARRDGSPATVSGVAPLRPTPLDEAMDRYARGEDEAFDQVFRRAAPRIFGFLLRVSGDRGLAEDLTQETFARIHVARGKFVEGSPALPWMFSIARNALVDSVRREQVRRATRDRGASPESPPRHAPSDTRGDEVLSARETLEIVRRTLEGIPRLQREAFVLLRFEGLSVREAAQVLGATESAVKLRAFGAYEALRAALQKEEGGSAGHG